jgi:hypothetical protein
MVGVGFDVAVVAAAVVAAAAAVVTAYVAMLVSQLNINI